MPSIGGKPHDKYSVSASSPGNYWGWASTLVGAKRIGAAIAKKEAYRGGWNVMFLAVGITKRDAPNSIFYKGTGWHMYIPVRGSGKRIDYIVAEIKRRHGVAPFKWTRR